MSNEPKHTPTEIESYSSLFDKCSLSDTELIKKVSEWNTKLCDSGGSKWSVQIPANVNQDPDLLIQELCLRFESLRAANAELHTRLENEARDLGVAEHEINQLKAANAELVEALRVASTQLALNGHVPHIVNSTLAKHDRP